MSFPSRRQSSAFLLPLRGKLTTFSVKNRQENTLLAKFILSCLYNCNFETKVLDVDALYSANTVFLCQGISPSFLKKVEVLMPDGLNGFEQWLIQAITGGLHKSSILDSLNTAHHILTYEDGKSAMQKLVTLTSFISKLARENNTLFMTTAYSWEHNQRRKRRRDERRALPMLGDIAVEVIRKSNSLIFQCEKGKAWKDGSFSVIV